MNSRIVVIGDALIDEMRDDDGVREFVGGAALNVAVGLRVLGLSSTLIAMVGDDDAGERIRAHLTTFDVELIATPSPSGSARAVSERHGGAEPVYVFNRASRERRIRYGDAERAAIAASDVVVVSCVAFDDREQTADLAGALSERGGALVVDPNPRAGMLRDRAAFIEAFEALVRGTDLVKVGDDDAALLYAAPLSDVVARLESLGAAAVLATAGADGASVCASGVTTQRPIAELPGPVIDTMGAGDSMTATFAAGLVAARPAGAGEWGALLERALLIAAATCRYEGALLRRTAPSSHADGGS